MQKWVLCNLSKVRSYRLMPIRIQHDNDVLPHDGMALMVNGPGVIQGYADKHVLSGNHWLDYRMAVCWMR